MSNQDLQRAFAEGDAEAARQERGPVPPDVTDAYAIGWLGSAIAQVVANDHAITDYEVIMEDPHRVIASMKVHGVDISITWNVTP